MLMPPFFSQEFAGGGVMLKANRRLS